MGEKARPQCYFEVEINREPIGRIVFQLFSDVCPKTCMNFLCLCTGEKGIGKVTGKKLCFTGSTFHRVVKNFMIQGGDFSEGNGKGGESIYGGYFEDENFILKHDRAFLLSMANRGKDTNGSQFFITTKPAPHLDGVHVVFGLVISGFEAIEQIENLKTDAASRPYADVRVINCGLVGAKPAKDVSEKVRRVSSRSEESSSKSSSPSSSSSTSESSSESEAERSRRKKRKRRSKVKHSKKRRKDRAVKVETRERRAPSLRSTQSDKNNAEDSVSRREKLVVRPEEIPPVPENRFLLRRDAPAPNPDTETKSVNTEPPQTDLQKSLLSKSGRKIRGRGTIRYHTPPRSRSRSESEVDDESSETPPHWKEEMQRLRTYKPPSGEKWSKGDKLNDRLSSHWDDGNVSPRSTSWSQDGYHSDDSPERASRSKTSKKDKKVKRKKKSKKLKHSKKHKPTKKNQPPTPKAESARSSSRREKPTQEQIKESVSGSSRESSKKDWSLSDKERGSSARSSKESRLGSRSRSRSVSRVSSRSRTASKSSSRSRSRSRSHSRSCSRTRSRSRKRARSRSRSMSRPPASPKSKHMRNVSRSPKTKESPLAGSKLVGNTETVKATQPIDKVVLPFAVADNIPVMPLSDSPPPSRWKPGQKPWKPSYERIQEIKVKASDVLPAQSKHAAVDKKSGSYRKRQLSSESESSGYSGRSYRRKSKIRSSRGRSYSRSYTRSRSRSSSGSRANLYSDSSSSRDRSSSYDSDDERPRRREKPSKEKLESHSKRQGQKNKGKVSSSAKSTDSDSNSGPSSDSEKESYRKRGKNQNGARNTQTNVNTRESDGDQKSRPEEVGDASLAVNSEIKEVIGDQGAKSEGMKESTLAPVKETSNMEGSRNVEDAAVSSGKEEGEASSESDTEAINQSKMVATLSPRASEDNTEKQTRSTPSRSSSQENEKGKSKKHKHRSSKKRAKKSHLKKAKEKSKRKKQKKHKVPKRKQVFHWQPPLEFGEEEEEDAVNEKPSNLIKRQDAVQGKESSPVNKSGKNSISLGGNEKDAEQSKNETSETCSGKTEEKEPVFSLNKSQTAPGKGAQNDEIKVRTHNRLLKLERSSPGHTQTSPAPGKSEQTSSSGATSVKGESTEAKTERAPSPPAVAASTTSAEKGTAGSSDPAPVDHKWKPVQGQSVLQMLRSSGAPANPPTGPEKKPQGFRIEIKSKSRVRPGSLFDEVRKTARLNQRPRNQESSSDEGSSSHREKSPASSRSKSRSVSSRRTRSRSYSRSRSRSHSYSSSSRSRSYTRSRSRRRHGSYRSRSRSRSYGSYRSYTRTHSRSRSRSASYERRRRSRSRSHTYDSYYSRSRSRTRSPRYRRSRSYDRRSSRSRRSYTSYSGSDRSHSRHRHRS
ncbi:NK-tumor recognition protein isoform X1 [Spea bombifrons]|uniref:NK-tumor recognition protein isoform X1 n=2 Tax=Spea bombifrons TaxID=233779 RepID=UPI00234B4C95|nr:NK-tumor recognition protein isoform X1 [Spea bombifrons]